MTTFTQAALIAAAALVAQTTFADAQSAKSADVGSSLRVLVHAVHTEATKTNVEEQLGVMMVVLNRADSGKYGTKGNLQAVVYNGEFNGPENHPDPWVKEPAAFKKTESVIAPYYQRWAAHEALNIPAGAKCAEHAKFFDMRAHSDFGQKACTIGGTFFYYGATPKKHQGKGVMTASRHHNGKTVLVQNVTKGNAARVAATTAKRSDNLKVASR